MSTKKKAHDVVLFNASKITVAVIFTCALITSIPGQCLRPKTRSGKKQNAQADAEESVSAKEFALGEIDREILGPEDRTVVLVTGYFEILHAGHVEFLSACKKSDKELLIVGVHSDKLARRIKGEDRPVLGIRDRITAIQGLEVVDYVFEAQSFYDDPPYHILRSIDPDIVVFSREPGQYEKKTRLVEFIENFAKDRGGRPEIRFVPIQRPGLHTTSIVEKIRAWPEKVFQQDRARWLRYIEFKLKDISTSGIEDAPTSAIFSQNGKIVGCGYNTRPAYSTDEEVFHLDTNTEEFRNGLPRPVHAEINALLDVLNSKEPVDFTQCEVYCLTAPCSACAETLANLNVAEVYYFQDFVNNFGILVLKKHGIPCKKIRSENIETEAGLA